MKEFFYGTILLATGTALVMASGCTSTSNQQATIHTPVFKKDPSSISQAVTSCLSDMQRNSSFKRLVPADSTTTMTTCEVPDGEATDSTDPTGDSSLGNILTDDSQPVANAANPPAPAATTSGITATGYQWVTRQRSYWIKKSAANKLTFALNLQVDAPALPDAKLTEADIVTRLDLICGPQSRALWSATGVDLAIQYYLDGKEYTLGSKMPTATPAASDTIDASALQATKCVPRAKRPCPTTPPTPPPTPVPDDPSQPKFIQDLKLAVATEGSPDPAFPALVASAWPDRGDFYPRGMPGDSGNCKKQYPNSESDAKKCRVTLIMAENDRFCQAYSRKVNEFVGVQNSDNAKCEGLDKPTVVPSTKDSVLDQATRAWDVVNTAQPVAAPKTYWSTQLTTDDLQGSVAYLCPAVKKAKELSDAKKNAAQKPAAKNPSPKKTRSMIDTDF